MVDGCHEADFWWLEGVILGEGNVKDEDTAGVRAVPGSKDDGLPVEN
jgi:hypothetical protein